MTPLILVTRGRLDMLASTLGSLYSLAHGRFSIYHVWQDAQSPYNRSYACFQLRKAFTRIGVRWIDYFMEGSVAACRAHAIRKALGDYTSLENVVMFDGDVLFHGDPITRALDGNQGVTGWTHLDVTGERGFADYTDSVLKSPTEYAERFGHLAHCDQPSPFHLYADPSDMHYVSTQAAWSIAALQHVGADRQSVLDVWANWPVGLRCYDVVGCRRIRELGYPIRILNADQYTLNLHLRPDGDEGYWIDDAVHPSKEV